MGWPTVTPIRVSAFTNITNIVIPTDSDKSCVTVRETGRSQIGWGGIEPLGLPSSGLILSALAT